MFRYTPKLLPLSSFQWTSAWLPTCSDKRLSFALSQQGHQAFSSWHPDRTPRFRSANVSQGRCRRRALRFKNDLATPKTRFVSEIPPRQRSSLLPLVYPEAWPASPNRTQYCSSRTQRKVHDNRYYRYPLKLMGRLQSNRRLGRLLNQPGHSSHNQTM